MQTIQMLTMSMVANKDDMIEQQRKQIQTLIYACEELRDVIKTSEVQETLIRRLASFGTAEYVLNNEPLRVA